MHSFRLYSSFSSSFKNYYYFFFKLFPRNKIESFNQFYFVLNFVLKKWKPKKSRFFIWNFRVFFSLPKIRGLNYLLICIITSHASVVNPSKIFKSLILIEKNVFIENIRYIDNPRQWGTKTSLYFINISYSVFEVLKLLDLLIYGVASLILTLVNS